MPWLAVDGHTLDEDSSALAFQRVAFEIIGYDSSCGIENRVIERDLWEIG